MAVPFNTLAGPMRPPDGWQVKSTPGGDPPPPTAWGSLCDGGCGVIITHSGEGKHSYLSKLYCNSCWEHFDDQRASAHEHGLPQPYGPDERNNVKWHRECKSYHHDVAAHLCYLKHIEHLCSGDRNLLSA